MLPKTKPYELKIDSYSSHQIIAHIIRSDKRFNTTLLDLGCDRGFLGKSLSSISPKIFFIDGVDINKINLKKSKPHYRNLYNFNLNDSHWPIKTRYDIIVVADTLEHLHDPKNTLKLALSMLKKNGILIISIPNSVFVWSRLRILLGDFPKDDRGIFDRTHLHFFTISTLKSLIYSFPNLTIENWHFSAPPIQFIFKKNNLAFNLLYKALHYLSVIRPTLFAYQLIVVAKKIS